jgi:hypothetical protein
MRRILIAILSAGWLLPLWLSAFTMFQYLSEEVWPRLAGRQPINSFPFVEFSSQAFTVACVWLALVIVFWAWRVNPPVVSPPTQKTPILNDRTPMRTLTLLLLCSMTACGPKRPAETSREISGTQAERVASVSSLISKRAPLPSPILDAHFAEEQTGDGQLGPSDFTAFYALSVAPADLAAWRSALPTIEAQNTPPKYITPKQPLPWWLTQNDFLGLTFYSPKSLTGRSNGWVGIAPDGRIFAYAFTM